MSYVRRKGGNCRARSGEIQDACTEVLQELDMINHASYHWRLCEKLGFDKEDKCIITYPNLYLNQRRPCKILWDFKIHADQAVEANQSDIVVIDKVAKEWLIIECCMSV